MSIDGLVIAQNMKTMTSGTGTFWKFVFFSDSKKDFCMPLSQATTGETRDFFYFQNRKP